jgi:glutamate-1-semialdehyde aminotransferase
VRFTNSGSEADLMAVLTPAMSPGVTGRRLRWRLPRRSDDILPGRGAGRVPFDFAALPYNDTVAVEAEFTHHGEEIACVLVEPMLGAGGCIPASPHFLSASSLTPSLGHTASLLVKGRGDWRSPAWPWAGRQQVYGVHADLDGAGQE